MEFQGEVWDGDKIWMSTEYRLYYSFGAVRYLGKKCAERQKRAQSRGQGMPTETVEVKKSAKETENERAESTEKTKSVYHGSQERKRLIM